MGAAAQRVLICWSYRDFVLQEDTWKLGRGILGFQITQFSPERYSL